MTRDEKILNMPAGKEMDDLITVKVIHDSIGPEWSPQYSTNISAVWEVVEKMRDTKGGIMDLIAHYDGSYFCVFQRNVIDSVGNVEWIGSSQAETAPLAICRAALLAVMDL